MRRRKGTTLVLWRRDHSKGKHKAAGMSTEHPNPRVVVPPTEEPVTLRELKRHLYLTQPSSGSNIEFLLNQIEQSAKRKLEDEGFPGDYEALETRIADLSLERTAKLYRNQLWERFKLKLPPEEGEPLHECVGRLLRALREKSLARGASNLARLLQRKGVVVRRFDGEGLNDYVRRLQTVGHKHKMELEWEEPRETEGPRAPVPKLDLHTIPQGTVHEDPGLFDFISPTIQALWALLRWIVKAKGALKSGDLEDTCRSIYYVGRCAVLAGVEEDAVLGARVRAGGAHGDERDSETRQELQAAHRNWQRRVNDIRNRRRDLSWTELSEQVGKDFNKTGRRIRQVCKDPAPPQKEAPTRLSQKSRK